MSARLTFLKVTDLEAPSTSTRKTASKASSAPRSRARGGAQRTSSGSSSKRRKAPWNPDAYRYAAKGSNRGYNNRGRGSSSSGYSNYRRSSSTNTANKRQTSTRPSGPAIDLMPTWLYNDGRTCHFVLFAYKTWNEVYWRIEALLC